MQPHHAGSDCEQTFPSDFGSKQSLRDFVSLDDSTNNSGHFQFLFLDQSLHYIIWPVSPCLNVQAIQYFNSIQY